QVTFSHGSTGQKACTSVTLDTSVESPQAPGATLPFSARSTGCSNPEYRFLLQAPGGSWTAKSGWSGATWTWNTAGLKTGAYGVTTFVLGSGPCISTDLSEGNGPNSGPMAPGGVTVFSAFANGCANARYQFWLLPPGGKWTSKQAYGENSTWRWDTTGRPTG